MPTLPSTLPLIPPKEEDSSKKPNNDIFSGLKIMTELINSKLDDLEHNSESFRDTYLNYILNLFKEKSPKIYDSLTKDKDYRIPIKFTDWGEIYHLGFLIGLQEVNKIVNISYILSYTEIKSKEKENED